MTTPTGFARLLGRATAPPIPVYPPLAAVTVVAAPPTTAGQLRPDETAPPLPQSSARRAWRVLPDPLDDSPTPKPAAPAQRAAPARPVRAHTSGPRPPTADSARTADTADARWAAKQDEAEALATRTAPLPPALRRLVDGPELLTAGAGGPAPASTAAIASDTHTGIGAGVAAGTGNWGVPIPVTAAKIIGEGPGAPHEPAEHLAPTARRPTTPAPGTTGAQRRGPALRPDAPGGPPAGDTSPPANTGERLPPVVIGQIAVNVTAPSDPPDPFAGCRVLADGLTARRGGGW